MNIVSLARLQFAITAIYHFFFVPLTMGLSIMVAIMETRYVRSNDVTYKRMAKFWGTLFLINFALGVVTGLVMEFQFGMNWSEYSRFVGDVFGAPLAIEALVAFFLESTFLGIWIFGWEKLSKRAHAGAMWMVAIGSNLSALWILIANSFMQEPVGYVIRNSRAEMADFLALLTNPNIFVQFPHVFGAGLTTAAFFMLGISAYHLLRKKEHQAFFFRSFRWAAVAGVIGTLIVIVAGHIQGQHVVRIQPMKMAAAEALWETQDPASFSIFTIANQQQMRDIFSIRIPNLLSILVYNSTRGEVLGIRDLQAQYVEQYGPGNYVPSVFTAYWTFRLMVGAGFLMFALAAYALYRTVRTRTLSDNRIHRLLPLAIGLPYFANTTGWLLAEMGRAPWAVYGLQRMEQAVSPNTGIGALLFSLIGFTLLYAALIAVDGYLLAKYALKGPIQAPTGDQSGNGS
jgi:cytochrome d ubiquinol oxidase subunit I